MCACNAQLQDIAEQLWGADVNRVKLGSEVKINTQQAVKFSGSFVRSNKWLSELL
jgi:hypothetical protein